MQSEVQDKIKNDFLHNASSEITVVSEIVLHIYSRIYAVCPENFGQADLCE